MDEITDFGRLLTRFEEVSAQLALQKQDYRRLLEESESREEVNRLKQELADLQKDYAELCKEQADTEARFERAVNRAEDVIRENLELKAEIKRLRVERDQLNAQDPPTEGREPEGEKQVHVGHMVGIEENYHGKFGCKCLTCGWAWGWTDREEAEQAAQQHSKETA